MCSGTWGRFIFCHEPCNSKDQVVRLITFRVLHVVRPVCRAPEIHPSVDKNRLGIVVDLLQRHRIVFSCWSLRRVDMSERPSTPPPRATHGVMPATPPNLRTRPIGMELTPEHVKRMEISRLKSKAVRQNDSNANVPQPLAKRQRMDASGKMERGSIQQSSYIEYNLDLVKDSKGGFMVEEDSLKKATDDRLKKIEESRRYNPPLSMNKDENEKCFECGSQELDFQFLGVFQCRVCFKCKAEFPDKYSLLTKTECKEDYLLTDPELRDVELMPHLLKPNPHNTTYSSMMLYLRYQVEGFAYKKWKGPDGLDVEYQRRVEEKRVKKDKKFELKLRELRKKTRVAKFSKSAARRLDGPHQHEYSESVENPSTGMSVRTCGICGLESEEIIM